MSDYERISGKKVEQLLDDLVKDKTLVKVATADHSFEKLTVITACGREKGELWFRIDPPTGLLDLLKRKPEHKLLFEFAGPGRLPHKFEAVPKEVASQVWLKGPDHVQRYQLRNNFRIKAPANARAVTTLQERQIRMAIENISLGGVMCHCPNSFKTMVFKDQVMEELDLFFMIGGESHFVTVNRAVIRRLEGKVQDKHFGVAMEFLAIKPDAQKHLTEIVYQLQRDQLKQRRHI